MKATLISQLKELLPLHSLEHDEESDSYFGSMFTERKETRLINGDTEINTGLNFIYVSGEMHPNAEKNFKYALQYTSGRQRKYHKKTCIDVELNKRFAAGKTDSELIKSIKENFVL